jgi:hypothetical protein
MSAQVDRRPAERLQELGAGRARVGTEVSETGVSVPKGCLRVNSGEAECGTPLT